jgi:microcystin-dependent protein
MTQPFLGQIQPLAFDFAPRGWAQCNGQILNISQNTALFSLLGTQYGGNGTTTFALPNLQSRAPMHAGIFQGETFFQGEAAGAETVTLTLNTMPAHNHAFVGTSTAGDTNIVATGQALASGAANPFYSADTPPLQPLNMGSISPFGGNQAHSNIQPYQAINWCIALSGIFPSRN